MMTPLQIKEIRKEAGLTQLAFARALGVGLRYVQALEQGAKTPSEPLKRIIEMLAAGELPKRYY